MEIIKTQHHIKTLEDIDKEIEEVKQRIKIKEAELTDTLNVLPSNIFKYLFSSLTSATSSIVGGSVLLTLIGSLKNKISTAANKNTNVNDGEEPDKKSFILNSLKNVGFIGLLKIAARIIRNI